jgi:capsular polysaccharide biosynthesis protein
MDDSADKRALSRWPGYLETKGAAGSRYPVNWMRPAGWTEFAPHGGDALAKTHSLSALIRRVVQAAWRRRALILTPFLVMLPISIAAALLLPKTYEASTLLMLQEGVRPNPLARDVPAGIQVQERFPGLEALLRSERVLGQVVEEQGYSGADALMRLRDLRDALQVRMIGSDFLEIRLKGGEAAGLGAALQAVTSQLLEALTSSEPGESARALILASHKAAADEAERRLAKLVAQSKTDRSDNPARDSDLMIARITAAETAVAEAKARYVEVSARGGSDSARPQTVGLLSAPERIRVLDSPKDPLFPTRSPILYVLFGLVASGLVGVGLAWVAERLDDRIRSAEDLAAAARVPVIAQLPQLGGAVVEEPIALGRPSLQWIVTVTLLVLIAGVAVALANSPGLSEAAPQSWQAVRDWFAGLV